LLAEKQTGKTAFRNCARLREQAQTVCKSTKRKTPKNEKKTEQASA
jgi:hypothetical protein